MTESDRPAEEELGDEPTNTEAVNDSGPETGSDATASEPVSDEAKSAAAEEGSSSADEGGSSDGDDTSDFDAIVAGVGESDLAAERLADLQRLQAEYVNYKRRVDRDRAVVQERAVQSVLDALLPVLDDIHAARAHGDLTGTPFERIAEKLETSLGRFGLEQFGAPGEAFDPMRHEALMHTEWPTDGSLPADADTTTVVQVLQPGYRAGEHVIRAARVSVADPA